jgi:hypothetical protein
MDDDDENAEEEEEEEEEEKEYDDDDYDDNDDDDSSVYSWISSVLVCCYSFDIKHCTIIDCQSIDRSIYPDEMTIHRQ